MAWYDDYSGGNTAGNPMDSIFGPSVLGGGFGVPNPDPILSSSGSTASAPWMSNGTSDMFGGTTPGADWLSSMPDLGTPGGSGGGIWDFLTKGLPGGLMGGFGINPSSILGRGADLAARTGPGIAALTYAGSQPGVDVGPLQGVMAGLGGNQDAIVRAATDPFQQNIAAGYGDLLQSQAQRGIRGSSFGDADIGNYISTTGRALSNAGANAAEGSLALQGNLAGNIAQLKNQSQMIKNSLYGRAFDVLGRGLNPGGYAGTTNVYSGGGQQGGGGSSGLGELGQIAGIGASIASIFSDRRLKSNIVKIGEDDRGFSIYEYDIFGERQRGVMADEVEKVMPGAVIEVAGLKMVDYRKLQ